MLVREAGLVMLNDLLSSMSRWSACHDDISKLAQRIICRCERFAVDSDYVTDDDDKPDTADDAAMDE